MKLSSRKTSRGGQELNLTSMIDVIFLLLIFFIVSAGFSKNERDLESNLQTQSTGARSNLIPVVVEIVPVGGSYQYKVGGQTAADAAQLTDVLRRIPTKGNGAFVRVKDDAPFLMAATAVQAAHDAGFLQVNYVVDRGK
jgi:biopolymer transport protein ExbD